MFLKEQHQSNDTSVRFLLPEVPFTALLDLDTILSDIKTSTLHYHRIYPTTAISTSTIIAAGIYER
jgi:hypothetical protein